MKRTTKIIFSLTLVFLFISVGSLVASAKKPRHFIAAVEDIEWNSNYHGEATVVRGMQLGSPMIMNRGERIDFSAKKLCLPLLNGNYLLIALKWIY